MTKQVQRRRGTATQHTSFTGAEGELSVNTTNKSVHVHDNVTAGGFEAARADMDNVTSSSILTAAGITATTAELNYVDGVTSNIQTQLDGKAGTASPTFTGTLTTANLTATGTTTLAGASTSADITFGDNDKAIFGAGSDLQIYHNPTGSHSYITESGGGSLYIQGTELNLTNSAGTSTYANFVDGGAAFIRHAGSTKLATTSTGVDITGTLTSDGLTVGGIVEIDGSAFGNTSKQAFTRTDASWSINNETNFRIYGSTGDTTSPSTKRMELSTNGDISFYENTGSTPKFFWSAADERLGIGTDSPQAALDLAGEINFSGLTASFPSPSQPRLYRSGSSAGSYPFNNFGHLIIQARGDGSNRDIVFATGTAGANKTVITSAGNVGIGTSSPSNKLDVKGTVGFEATNSTNSWLAYTYTDNTFRINYNGAGADEITIDSSGNVGIGVADPDSALEVQSSASGLNSVHLSNTSSTGYGAKFIGGGNTSTRYIADFRDYSGASKLRLDGDGNVGIGTSSPSSQIAGAANLVIGDTSDADSGMTFVTSTTGQGLIHFSDATSGNARYDGFIGYEQNNRALKFGTAQAEAMRIDSGGNLLVGTSYGFGDVTVKNHIQLYNNDADGPSDLDATIGEISSQVRNYGGSISTARFSSIKFCVDPSTYYYGDIRFFTNNSDGTSNAGTEKVRIRAQGGITFNGDTAAANALDDYEEGSYTPTVYGANTAGSTTLNSSFNKLHYTKIGRQVTIGGEIRISGSASGSGFLRISTPFTNINESGSEFCGAVGVWGVNHTDGASLTTSISKGSDYLRIIESFDNASNESALSITDLATNAELTISITFFTS